ncbi:centrosomal protein of 89 kDa isoform X2 [Erythrolamprus reginae]|uniref:centrosomal protein of 89 kDa isoform X2 n=1 Tax=Erythrolamprus reginae TaxID=121349 RepID=UPI00396C48DB
MPFFFRKRRNTKFTNIAPGLVPAATLAPKPAVPRTPPPRSPNPSPERPRSALAAAILSTALTGQTIAIPQPRSASGSAAPIEPYATVTELRMGNSKRKSHDKYVMPHQTQQENLPVSYSGNSEEDDSVCKPSGLLQPNVQVEEIKYPRRRFKTNIAPGLVPAATLAPKPAVPRTLPPRSPNPSPERPRSALAAAILSTALTGQTVAIPQPRSASGSAAPIEPYATVTELRMGNSKRKSHDKYVMPHQIQQEYLPVSSSAYSEEDDSIWKPSGLLQLDFQVEEIEHPRTRFKGDNSDETQVNEKPPLSPGQLDSLEKISHVAVRSSASKYLKESAKTGSLPLNKPIPPCLLDTGPLSPLLLLYEEQMNEKDELILEHEESMKMLKAQAKEVVKENQQLLHKLSKTVTTEKWQQLKHQAELVLEENTMLREHIKKQKNKEVDGDNQVYKLTKELHTLKNEKKNQESEMEELRSQYAAMENKFKNELQMEQEKREKETQELMEKLASLQTSLSVEKNVLVVQNKTLKAQLKMAQDTKSNLEQEIGVLKQHLEESIETEMTSHKHLKNMVILAENIAEERDQLLNRANCLEKEKGGFLNKIEERNVRVGKLEDKVKVQEKMMADMCRDLKVKSEEQEQEQEFAGKEHQYQRQMKHLQQLVRDKQDSLEEALREKKELENELEVVWESTTRETLRMKEFLKSSLQRNT